MQNSQAPAIAVLQNILVHVGTPNTSLLVLKDKAVPYQNIFVVQNEAGQYFHAVKFNELYAVHETSNQTVPAPGQEAWTEEEFGRPGILFTYNPTQEFLAGMQTVQAGAGNRTITAPTDHLGRVIINNELRPLRFSPHLPEVISTDIEGWYVEAIMRLDPSITIADIRDRMPVNNRVSHNGVDMRAMRARTKLRCKAWKGRHQETWAERRLKEQLEAAGSEYHPITNNSTSSLPDLTTEEYKIMEYMRYDPQVGSRADEAKVKKRLGQYINDTMQAGAGFQLELQELRRRLDAWSN